MFWKQNKTRLSCEEFRGEMVVSYLCHQMERTHIIVLSQTRGVDVGGGGTETYIVSFLRILKLLA